MGVDTSNPACPDCGEPVGTRADYCMHCGAEFDDPVGGAATDDADATGPVAPDPDGASVSDASSRSDESTRSGGLLRSDGRLDGALTVAVGVAAGLFVGIAAAFAVGSAFPVGGGGAGLLAWVGTTGYVLRSESVFGAVRLGAYAVAVALVVGPLGIATGADGGLAGVVVGYLLMAVPLGVVALALVAVGYLAGRARPA
ncbi:zinc ribbon domain-containing protein [Halosimplex litoreum]|uniref:Zinc ribbon domain-containing protein n=1 Tax=Halosimplex litoreum TaxID=1198301 RepID=A0A7T3KUA8_9EURY|nr:zinc ribbon domain-containing protein [Halosimplex litoreum]QPV61768.1 zinc ribbon domain-containing protein [Halosimplex litoreum]